MDSLLRADGEAVLACSSQHEDGVTDGRYDPCLTLDFGRVLTGYAEIEAIFNMCRTTVSLCSIESIMDTPFREQAQWLGDVAAVTVPCIYACFGDSRLPRKFLDQAAMNTRPTGLIANISNVSDASWQNDIPDYSLWWVIALWNYYLYSGDVTILHQCYPEMQRVMRVHLERLNSDGLLNQMFGWVFIDWANVDTQGVSSVYNALFAGACDAAAAVATVKQDEWAVSVYTDAAKGIRATFKHTFWDPEKRLIVDARWGERMLDRGRTSCTEEWYENGSWRSGKWAGFERTHSHAWSACPAVFLTKGLLGLEILDAGCRRISLNPYRGDFAYSASYPTPLGDIAIEWNGQNVSLSVPDGVTVVDKG